MTVNKQPGHEWYSVVMANDELEYRGGLGQGFSDIPPNTTFYYSAWIKTVDVEDLEARILFVDVEDSGHEWIESHEWGVLEGSHDWTFYETEFTTPDEITNLNVYPALVTNRGEVWIDEASLTIEGWQPPTAPIILNWFHLHKPWGPFYPFVTEADLEYVEQKLKAVSIENFWGIVGVPCEEHYRLHVDFDDDVNTTYFGEDMLGYPIYEAANPGATVGEWKDEMFLRMIRGFYDYFSPSVKVGITAGNGAAEDIPVYFGEPAMDFIREHYYFVIHYYYTTNLEDFNTRTKQAFQLSDQLFAKQMKFWILTRDDGRPGWQLETMALELKNCFDRNMVVMIYYSHDPPFAETWDLMLLARELYDAKAPYYESLVSGLNLLTGQEGETYGWVEVLG